MQFHGLYKDDYFILKENSRLDVPTGEELTLQALKSWNGKLPTAILAANDSFAIGIIHKLTEAGIRVAGRNQCDGNKRSFDFSLYLTFFINCPCIYRRNGRNGREPFRRTN